MLALKTKPHLAILTTLSMCTLRTWLQLTSGSVTAIVCTFLKSKEDKTAYYQQGVVVHSASSVLRRVLHGGQFT